MKTSKLTKDELQFNAVTRLKNCSTCGGYFRVCNICEDCKKSHMSHRNCHKASTCKFSAEVMTRQAGRSGWSETHSGKFQSDTRLVGFNKGVRMVLKRQLIRMEIYCGKDAGWVRAFSVTYAQMEITSEGVVRVKGEIHEADVHLEFAGEQRMVISRFSEIVMTEKPSEEN